MTVLEALDRLGGRAHTIQTGSFAGTEEGAHWVHGGTENVPVSRLLSMYNVSQVRVGGDDDYEGARNRLMLVSPRGVPLSAAQRDLSFDLFASARAASEAYAKETDSSQGTQAKLHTSYQGAQNETPGCVGMVASSCPVESEEAFVEPMLAGCPFGGGHECVGRRCLESSSDVQLFVRRASHAGLAPESLIRAGPSAL